MAELRYSPAARADLEKIASDIVANNGVAVAERVIGRLRKSLAHLSVFPDLGRSRPGLGVGIRSWPLRPYLAFYRTNGRDVEKRPSAARPQAHNPQGFGRLTQPS